MSSTALRVIRSSQDSSWCALAGDEEAGRVKAFVRPDQRCFLFFGTSRADAYEPLLRAAAGELRRDLYVTVDEADEDARRRYGRLGFVSVRREIEYAIATDPDVTGLAGIKSPFGYAFLSADQVEEDRLRALDDVLRQDVPGTDGWRWDAGGFRGEAFDSPHFDPATYLVAVEEASGEYAGLVRVWNNPNGARLGLIAVVRPHRRRGLARGLLAHAFAVLHERGKTDVSAEVDETNVASISLLESLGARHQGGSLELIRRAHGPR